MNPCMLACISRLWGAHTHKYTTTKPRGYPSSRPKRWSSNRTAWFLDHLTGLFLSLHLYPLWHLHPSSLSLSLSLASVAAVWVQLKCTALVSSCVRRLGLWLMMELSGRDRLQFPGLYQSGCCSRCKRAALQENWPHISALWGGHHCWPNDWKYCVCCRNGIEEQRWVVTDYIKSELKNKTFENTQNQTTASFLLITWLHMIYTITINYQQRIHNLIF